MTLATRNGHAAVSLAPLEFDLLLAVDAFRDGNRAAFCRLVVVPPVFLINLEAIAVVPL